LKGLDIIHSRSHHQFHISAEFDDVEILGHLTDKRDIEQNTEPCFLTEFRREEYSANQSKSCNRSENRFPLGLEEDGSAMQSSSDPRQLEILETLSDGEYIRQYEQKQSEHGDDSYHDKDGRIDQRADVFIFHVSDIDVFRSQRLQNHRQITGHLSRFHDSVIALIEIIWQSVQRVRKTFSSAEEREDIS